MEKFMEVHHSKDGVAITIHVGQIVFYRSRGEGTAIGSAFKNKGGENLQITVNESYDQVRLLSGADLPPLKRAAP